jgi:hypothetical protein
MKSLIPVALVLSLSALCADPPGAQNPAAREKARSQAMSSAAGAWLAALPLELKVRANPPFESEDRTHWGYMEGERQGIALGEQSGEERELLDGLLREGLSEKGLLKVRSIMSLQEVLQRDPNSYFAAVFGDPAGAEPWGWRLEGHHVSLNFTVRNGDFVTATPLFLGADPAEVAEGPQAGQAPFGEEETVLRSLVDKLGAKVRTPLGHKPKIPDDVFLGPARNEPFAEREGVQPGEIGMSESFYFMKLLNLHVSVVHPDLALKTMERYREHDIKDLDFVWSGSDKPGEPFYYRLQGLKKGVAVEYLNRGNHVHCVWRDFHDDFGARPIAAWEQRKAEDGEDGGDQ